MVIKTIQSNTANEIVPVDVSALVSGVYTIKVICGAEGYFKAVYKVVSFLQIGR